MTTGRINQRASRGFAAEAKSTSPGRVASFCSRHRPQGTGATRRLVRTLRHRPRRARGSASAETPFLSLRKRRTLAGHSVPGLCRRDGQRRVKPRPPSSLATFSGRLRPCTRWTPAAALQESAYPSVPASRPPRVPGWLRAAGSTTSGPAWAAPTDRTRRGGPEHTSPTLATRNTFSPRSTRQHTSHILCED